MPFPEQKIFDKVDEFNQYHQMSLLYVDDDQDLLEVVKKFLEQSGTFRVDTMTSALEALKSPYSIIRCHRL
jgi:PleD family two-component response regulator